MKARQSLRFSLPSIIVLVETFIREAEVFNVWHWYKQIIKEKKKGKEMLQPPSGAGWHLLISFITKPARAK